MRIKFETTLGETVSIWFRHTRYDLDENGNQAPDWLDSAPEVAEGLPARGRTECVIHGADDRVVTRGESWCSRMDNFCKESGRKLALTRATHALDSLINPVGSVGPDGRKNLRGENTERAMDRYRNRPRTKGVKKEAAQVEQSEPVDDNKWVAVRDAGFIFRGTRSECEEYVESVRREGGVWTFRRQTVDDGGHS